jgi:hypothetical protein
MNVQKYHTLFLFFFWSGLVGPARAQEASIQIELGTSPLALNRPFTITVLIRDSEERSYDRFPDLPGFTKRGTTTTTVNDRTGITQRITQSYMANRPGVFLVPPFSMVVNGQTVRSSGGPVTVTTNDAEGSNETTGGAEPDDVLPSATLPGKTDAFLALQANRNHVYVGEGFTVRLAFLVADDARQELQFYQLSEQVAEILPRVRPANCWEENFGISGEPQTRRVTLNGRTYTEYRVFEAAYFPLNAQPVAFPSVSLNVLTKPAGKAEPVLQTFRTTPFAVQPRPLPPHPQRERAAVGTFRWQESLTPTRGRTGQTLTYTVRLTGEGNLAGIDLRTPANDEAFDFYPPDVQQSVDRRAGRVAGEKVFSFPLIPKKAGTFALARYWSFVFFDPHTGRYETLRPTTTVRISGAALVGGVAERPGETLYADLDRLDSTTPVGDYRGLLKHGANLLLAILLAGAVAIFWRSKT